MSAAVQEALHLRSLLLDFGVKCSEPIIIKEDNQSCIKMCRNPVMQKRSKHIDVKFHFIRERIEDGTIQLEYCPTELMQADLLTKALTFQKVEKHRNSIMGCSLIVGNKFSLSGGVNDRSEAAN